MKIFIMFVMIILATGAAVLAACLWCYRKQTIHLLKELKVLEQSDANILLTSEVPIGKTDEVIAAMNQVLNQYRRNTEKLLRENRSYRESLTGISHDIRTPLTSVKGYVQMLYNPRVTEEKKEEYVKVIGERLDDLTGMLNQLFEYTRIEAGEFNLEIEELNVCNLFAETISMFYEDFQKKGCDPEVYIPAKPCYIRADRNAFTRILENLMKNALVHGIGDYRFFLSEEENRVEIEISNRTNSIESRDLDRIFDRFYTTDQSRSRKTTGLGLAIVKEFTVQMGGTAEALLEGDRFTIRIRFPNVL